MFFKKSIIALTGLFLCIFLIVHLSANCILLLPKDIARDLYNSYSTTLRESLFIKIIAYVLYLSILLHVVYALLITLRNRKAKSQHYSINNFRENSSWASQNMGLLGVIILLFILVHLANFWARIKLGIGENIGLDANGHVNVYEVTYGLFQNIYFVMFYTVLMIPLGLHLNHGLKSAFMTLGFYHKKGLRILAKTSLIYATIMTVGFGIIPFILFFK
ncbi:succinate dehydrogenase cytochrome b subunit [Flavivirga rizhaonensis]|uniref:Succinate dehydrogenase cytochrome b subunit n=1 Tax=Flavivirga rizhaonensis TaxID=2559571 RepID=A0A4S1E2I9_9FLAO|nr:succinate dehydrogenase cytochrome b subunit [Flavivirga rizhaonensis]TGV04847.1 succinate dehydrogenase cytochrome b subunit [Flavivirga rizhaonensis]